jgi:hypothetical protein
VPEASPVTVWRCVEFVNDRSGVVRLPYALVRPYSTCPVAGSLRLQDTWALFWEIALAVTALMVGPADGGIGVAVGLGVGVALGVRVGVGPKIPWRIW